MLAKITPVPKETLEVVIHSLKDSSASRESDVALNEASVVAGREAASKGLRLVEFLGTTAIAPSPFDGYLSRVFRFAVAK